VPKNPRSLELPNGHSMLYSAESSLRPCADVAVEAVVSRYDGMVVSSFVTLLLETFCCPQESNCSCGVAAVVRLDDDSAIRKSPTTGPRPPATSSIPDIQIFVAWTKGTFENVSLCPSVVSASKSQDRGWIPWNHDRGKRFGRDQ
jgi:hypothetical protein